jgi:hypothetical protein
MVSISELSERWGIPYKRLNRWVNEFGLGEKVGWAVILTDEESEKLKSLIKDKQINAMGKPGRPVVWGEAA